MKIAIAGYGLEGEENYKYWAAEGGHDITIVDESLSPTRVLPDGVPTMLGEGVFEKLQGFDMVIRTAGLAPYKIKTDGKIWSATNEFFEKTPAKIIGVTGTKGKGTMSSLIAAIFEASGKKVWLVGNNGISAIKLLDQIGSEDIVVFELSSFQLWDLERSPHTAVVGLIEPDHLNVHTSMEDYVNAKGSIRRHQTGGDICIYHPTNHYSHQIATSASEGTIMRYGIPDDGGVYERDGEFQQNGDIICPTGLLQLIGQHNIENACAAITVARAHGLSIDAIEDGLRNFKGLPHRLEYVRKFNEVDYYNDSFSSAPPASVAAVKSFTQPEIVIFGGIDKSNDFSILINTIRDMSNVKEIILIGEIRHKLAQQFSDAGVSAKTTVLDATTMDEIVRYASSVAQPGDVVLLSPGTASFDMFKDFYDRGDQFRNIVNKL
jgi:UDP-N-acetylmuramoylalanine--D-glutamate ligase